MTSKNGVGDGNYKVLLGMSISFALRYCNLSLLAIVLHILVNNWIVKYISLGEMPTYSESLQGEIRKSCNCALYVDGCIISLQHRDI